MGIVPLTKVKLIFLVAGNVIEGEFVIMATVLGTIHMPFLWETSNREAFSFVDLLQLVTNFIDLKFGSSIFAHGPYSINV